MPSGSREQLPLDVLHARRDEGDAAVLAHLLEEGVLPGGGLLSGLLDLDRDRSTYDLAVRQVALNPDDVAHALRTEPHEARRAVELAAARLKGAHVLAEGQHAASAEVG